MGELTLEKLDVVRRATKIVEERLSGMGMSRWFTAAWEYEVSPSEDLARAVNGLSKLNTYLFRVRATGVKGDSRAYSNVVLISSELGSWSSVYELFRYLGTVPSVTHVVYELASRGVGRYFVSIRAVLTEDFMTADVARLPREVLMDIAREIMGNDDRVVVGYDVTPKPPLSMKRFNESA